MSRWHSSSCSNPRIIVQEQRPRCESCNSFPDIDGLVVEQASKPLPIPYLPPDEPQGQMHLWWPPCVPYVTTGPDGHPVPIEPPKEESPMPYSDEGESLSELDRRHIYPQRLEKNGFRVLCLAPVDDANDPVHISLEVYDDHCYHEYETVSYTWAGENGDSSLSQPVYVGSYWDILLQTHNCWEMLRYLRPWRGVRVVWVDAICINQTDMRERQAQVAKMGRIYENASRLEIYLGPDLVPPTSTSTPYPRRHLLQEFDSLPEKPRLPSASSGALKQWKLSDILDREYFRRLWIVQELIMSRNITLRVGDVEFAVGQKARSPMNIGNKIPWFHFVTKKSIVDPTDTEPGNNLKSAVKLVAASRASDPRDKIFGVLGLINCGEPRIAAAYSISFRHLAIGYYAYCLLVKKDVSVLIHAPSFQGPEGMPTWAPHTDCFTSSERHFSFRGNQQHIWPNTSIDLQKAYSKHHECRKDLESVFERSFPSSVGRNGHHCFKLTYHDVRETYTNITSWHFHPTIDSSIGAVNPSWHSHAAIDSSTGAVHLKAMHLLSFDDFSTPEIDREGDVRVYTLKSGTITLLIYAHECIFSPKDELSELHLFVLCENPEKDWTRLFQGDSKSSFCVLRQVNGKSKFRLISASVVACFHAPYRILDPFCSTDSNTEYSFTESLDAYRLSSNKFAAYDERLGFCLPLIRINGPAGKGGCDNTSEVFSKTFSLNIQNLRLPFCCHMDRLQKLWGDGDPKSFPYFSSGSEQLFTIRYPSPKLAFPGIKKTVILVEVFQNILDAERGGSSMEFVNTYFRAVREFSPKLIQWKNRHGKVASHSINEPERFIDLVQLRFEPDQYDVLERILDSIQTDLKQVFDQWHQHKNPTVDETRDQFCPPLLRFGWRDLAQNQTGQLMENRSLKDKDVHGYYPLDDISEAFEKWERRYFRWSFDFNIVREHRDQTIWVAFDLLSLMQWAQTHRCMAALRGLSRFCTKGENEMTRLLRPLTVEETNMTYSDWPPEIMENFKIRGEFRSITII